MNCAVTLERPTERFSGIGLHSGIPSWLEVLPSEGTARGIVFQDAKTDDFVVADVDHVVSTDRCTTIGYSSIEVHTVEHLLSALSGLGITDAVVRFSGEELPIGDGSAEPFVRLLQAAGKRTLDVRVRELSLKEPLTVTDGRGGVITGVPSERLWLTAVIDYRDRPAIGLQGAHFGSGQYAEEVAPARTFGFHYELEALTRAGLGRGANASNVVALLDDGSADPQTPLRFSNELALHKLLDLIGDLSLSQLKLNAGIIALKPSHTLNVEFARQIVTISQNELRKDPSQ